jgi:hypothetical protein
MFFARIQSVVVIRCLSPNQVASWSVHSGVFRASRLDFRHSEFPWFPYDSSTYSPSMRFCPFRRFLAKAATNIELASLDCAPPSGFLDLLTVYSAFAISALSHTESVRRVLLSEVSPSPEPPRLSPRLPSCLARCPPSRRPRGLRRALSSSESVGGVNVELDESSSFVSTR